MQTIVTAPPGPRLMKQTLSSRHFDKISSHLTNGVTVPAEYGAILKEIHCDAVAGELRLSRGERSTLAQLRTGECHLLGNYQVKTGGADCATCPECRFRRQKVQHLFSRDATPTGLATRDLLAPPSLTSKPCPLSLASMRWIPRVSYLRNSQCHRR